MLEQNKETVQQLKGLAICLKNIAQTMRVQYRILSLLAYAEVLYLIVISVFLRFSSRVIQELDSAFYTIILLLIVDMFAIVNYVRLCKQGHSFRQKYQEGREILQTMADKAEWTRYKKRLIYRGSDENTTKAIDAFFSVSEKMWSPCRSEKKYYIILALMVPVYVLISFLAFVVYNFMI